MRFSRADAAALIVKILRSLDEESMPVGTEREWKYGDGTRTVYKARNGDWLWKDDDSLARPARLKFAGMEGKRGQAFPSVKRSGKVKTAADCPSTAFFYEPTGKCIKGIEMVRNIADIIEGAQKHADARDWYRDVKAKISGLLRSESPKMLALIAATSQGMSLQDNIDVAFDVYLNDLRGTYPEGLSPNTVNKATNIAGVRKNIDRILAGDFELGGPKIGPFRKAMFGDELAVTIDRHMFKLFFGLNPKIQVPGKKDPEKTVWQQVDYPKEFLAFAQEQVRKVAKKLGWTPAETQAALWVFWLKDLRPVEDPVSHKRAQAEGGHTDYLQVFEARGKQINNLLKEIERLKDDWSGGVTASAPEYPFRESTIWGVIGSMQEGKVPKRKKRSKTQLHILNSIIGILEYQRDAYRNAGKLVKEIQRMHKSGEIDEFIDDVRASGGKK